MSNAREGDSSRRNFFKSFANGRTLRSLGGIAGMAAGIVSKLRGQDSCEAAGMALARQTVPLDCAYRDPSNSEEAITRRDHNEGATDINTGRSE